MLAGSSVLMSPPYAGLAMLTVATSEIRSCSTRATTCSNEGRGDGVVVWLESRAGKEVASCLAMVGLEPWQRVLRVQRVLTVVNEGGETSLLKDALVQRD